MLVLSPGVFIHPLNAFAPTTIEYQPLNTVYPIEIHLGGTIGVVTLFFKTYEEW